jgi:hypothetical protein
MSDQVFNLIVAICMLVITVFIAAWVVGMLIAVFKIKGAVQSATQKAEPAIVKAQETMGSVNSIVHTVQERVEGISATAEDTVETVSRRIKGTANALSETTATRAATLSSVVLGVSRALELYHSVQKRKETMSSAA